MISEESINDIREKVNLVDVISDYMTLKKTGRTHKGLCPFHREKTPSFVVDTQKQLYHCFGCSEGGNVFNFVMKVENLDFVEAVELLAKKSGVNVNYSSGSGSKRERSQKECYQQINKEAAGFYHQKLMKTEQGKVAREYLKSRAYGKETAQSFKLGYAPKDGRSLTSLLLKKGFKQQDLVTLNLTYDSSGPSKDRFINRLMFPIEDARGNVVAFGGRALSEDDKAKYLNSAQTPLFNKSKQFYGLNVAKNEIVNKDQAILVEGYTDVISMHQGGFKNTIATLGTALTVNHLEILSRFCSSAVMLFDSDEAGLKAAERSIEFADQTNLEILVAVLPEGDPADFVYNKGAKELQALISSSKPLIDFCLSQVVAKGDLRTPKKRVMTINKAFELIRNQKNEVLEQESVQNLARLTGIDIGTLSHEYGKIKQPTKENVTIENALSAEERAESLFLSILIEDWGMARNAKFIVKDDFTNEKNKEIFEILTSNKGNDVSLLVNEIDSVDLKNRLSALCFSKKPQDLGRALQDASHKIKDFTLKRHINRIKAVLEKTNPVDKPQDYDKLFKELIDLEAQRRDLRKEPLRSINFG